MLQVKIPLNSEDIDAYGLLTQEIVYIIRKKKQGESLKVPDFS
jgi:hypothetical protein